MEDVGTRGRRSAWALAIGWAALIWVASSISRPWLPPADFVPTDKVAHGLVFGVLGWLVFRALSGGRRSWRAAVVSAVVALGYGVVDEIHQRFVPGRTPSALDVLADGLGATLAVSIAVMLRRP